MLTRQSPPLTAQADDAATFDSGRIDPKWIALRIVRSEEGNPIQVQDLLPAWPRH